MTKYLMLRVLFLFAATGLIFTNSGCTSKKTEDSQAAVENADVEKIEAEGLDMSADASLDAAMGANAQAPTIEESGQTPDSAVAAEATPTEAPPAVEVSQAPTIDESVVEQATPSAPAPETAASETPTAAPEAMAPPTQETTSPFAETQAPVEMAPAPAAPKVATGTLKKIGETTPYQQKSGGWVNTVYVARPKETLKEISQKIYGADKTKDLKKIAENSYLKYRSVKAGDKIYYVSPNRPDDSTRTLVYFEDAGVVPDTYVAKKGDNLRKISKELLGYDNAWKEVWTSNTVDSKTALKEGETLRFWKAEAAPTMAAAPTEPAKLIDAAQAPAMMEQAAPTEMPPAPPETQAQAEMPPPPPEAQMPDLPPPPPEAQAQAEMPPPPPAEMAAPPPPPPVDQAEAAPPHQKVNLDEAAAEEDGGEELDSDTMMSLGAVGLLVALMAYIIIRKKKQKAAQLAETQTNISVQ